MTAIKSVILSILQNPSKQTEQTEGYQSEHTDTGKPLIIQTGQTRDDLFLCRNRLTIVVSSNRLGTGGICAEQGADSLSEGGGYGIVRGGIRGILRGSDIWETVRRGINGGAVYWSKEP